jgi:hypothetical protein
VWLLIVKSLDLGAYFMLAKCRQLFFFAFFSFGIHCVGVSSSLLNSLSDSSVIDTCCYKKYRNNSRAASQFFELLWLRTNYLGICPELVSELQ